MGLKSRNEIKLIYFTLISKSKKIQDTCEKETEGEE